MKIHKSASRDTFLDFFFNTENSGVYSLTHRIHGTGIFTYIWMISMVNVGKYTIHGSYGIDPLITLVK